MAQRGSGGWGQNTPYLSPWLGGSGTTSNTPAQKPAPTSPAPAASPAPQMPAPTYDSTYFNELALGQSRFDTHKAGTDLQRGRVSFDTGFGAGGQVDLSNPYNQAMMLQRSWEQGQRGITNSMARRTGGLYSGAHGRALDEGSFQYERNRSNLQTGAKRAYEDLSMADRIAQDDLTASRFGAEAGQSQRWTDAQHEWFAKYG